MVRANAELYVSLLTESISKPPARSDGCATLSPAGSATAQPATALLASPNTNAVTSSAPKTAYALASGILGTRRQIGIVFSMGVTMMAFALYVGPVQIAPKYYPLFQKSMQTCFMVFAGLCLAGTFASLARGKLR